MDHHESDYENIRSFSIPKAKLKHSNSKSQSENQQIFTLKNFKQNQNSNESQNHEPTNNNNIPVRKIEKLFSLEILLLVFLLLNWIFL